MMKRGLTAAALMVAGAVSVGTATTAHADGETEVVVYRDQVYQPDTRSAGHVSWPLGGGIRLTTDDSSSQAKATFAFDTQPGLYPPEERIQLGGNASQGAVSIEHDISVRSGGDQATPGIQIYLDLDLNGTPEMLLVKEDVYQVNGHGDPDTSDVWMTNGSPASMRPYAPSCEPGHPELETMTSDQAISSGLCSGGSGSAWHGSETAWAEAIYSDAGYSDDDYLLVRALGESLGSGVKGNVLVSSISYGSTFFTFSRQNAPEPEPVAVDPTTRIVTTIDVSCRTAVFTVTLPEPGENEYYAPQTAVGFRMMSAGQLVLRDVADPGESFTRTVTFTRSSTNVPRVKLFTTAPGQAPTAYPNVLEVDQGVNRNCSL